MNLSDTPIDSPAKISQALKNADRVAVTKSLYWYFLEVLPPRDIGYGYFVFQEGDGEKLLFTDDCDAGSDAYYCTLLSDTLMTEDFSLSVNISRGTASNTFTVNWINDHKNEVLSIQNTQMIGKEFSNPAAIERAMDVSFRA